MMHNSKASCQWGCFHAHLSSLVTFLTCLHDQFPPDHALVQSKRVARRIERFLTFAWYAHLRNLRARPLIIAIAASWGIALFEYSLQVPANRSGYETLSLGQLKI